MIAFWPGQQRITLPGEEIAAEADALRGSFEFPPDPALPIDAVTLHAQNARLTSTAGWNTGFAAGQISMRATPGAQIANSYDLFLDAADIAPTPALRDRIGAASGLPDRIARLQLRATAVFDKRWDRTALEDARPQPRQMTVEAFEMRWGGVHVVARGALEIDAEGQPTGQLDATITNWRAFLKVLAATGRLDQEKINTVEQGLTLLATLNGNPEVLEVPLLFAEGMMRIGPVPVMAAPILALP